MRLIVAWYAYQYIVRKLFKTRLKEFNNRTEVLSLTFIFIFLLFIISLFTYLFDIEIIKNILDDDLPLGPIAGIVGFIIFLIISIVYRPKLNSEVVSNMRISYELTKKMDKGWSIFLLIFVFTLFILTFLFLVLAMK